MAANRDFSPVVNTWADTDVIMATPLNQLASCNSECCKGVLQLVGINWNIVLATHYRCIFLLVQNVDSLLSFQHKVREYQQYCTTVQVTVFNVYNDTTVVVCMYIATWQNSLSTKLINL